MTKGVADIEIAVSTAARGLELVSDPTGSSPRIGGVTEGDSRHACAEASISTFEKLEAFNRDRPAVAADQARRGEGGGDHAAALSRRDHGSICSKTSICSSVSDEITLCFQPVVRKI